MGVVHRVPGDVMRTLPQLARRLYGERILHLIVLLAALALTAYTVSVLGVDNLFNPVVWWQSIAVWFAVAVIGHDFILFPLYALAERLLPRPRRTDDPHHGVRNSAWRLPLTNYLRMPSLASGLLFVMFFPGIIRQGAFTYHAATGLTQAPYLNRWLLITAACYLTSAVWYVAKTVLRHPRSTRTAPRSTPQAAPAGTDVAGP
jgi:hypothetical protein